MESWSEGGESQRPDKLRRPRSKASFHTTMAPPLLLRCDEVRPGRALSCLVQQSTPTATPGDVVLFRRARLVDPRRPADLHAAPRSLARNRACCRSRSAGERTDPGHVPKELHFPAEVDRSRRKIPRTAAGSRRQSALATHCTRCPLTRVRRLVSSASTSAGTASNVFPTCRERNR